MSYMSNFGEVEKLRFSFMLFDADGDGFLDRGELIQLVSAIHVGLNKQELDTLFRKVDDILKAHSTDDTSKYRDAKLTFDKLVKVCEENPGLFSILDNSPGL